MAGWSALLVAGIEFAEPSPLPSPGGRGSKEHNSPRPPRTPGCSALKGFWLFLGVFEVSNKALALTFRAHAAPTFIVVLCLVAAAVAIFFI